MSSTILEYRQLTEEDLAEVATLEAASFPTPWTENQYRAVMRQGGCALFGALKNKTLIGYIAVAVYKAAGEMEVYNIAVETAERKKGVGNRLLSLVVEAAGKIGIEQIALEVRVSNIPAIALYTSLGFEQAGVRRGYYHDTEEDALVFIKTITPRS